MFLKPSAVLVLCSESKLSRYIFHLTFHSLLSSPPAAPAINWSRGVSSHSGGGIKPTGLAEVHSKFRPVKRVSPLKHHPETTDSDSDGKLQNQGLGEPGEGSKDDPTSDKPCQASTSTDGSEGKAKGLSSSVGVIGGNNPQALFGELEHYDLDMDEILDVPYIKSSQQMSTLPRVPHDKRSVTGSNLGGGTLERSRGLESSALPHNEPLSLGSSSLQTPVNTCQALHYDDLFTYVMSRTLARKVTLGIYVFSAVLRAVSGEVVRPEEVQVHGSRPPPPAPLPSWRRVPVGVALLRTPQLLLLSFFFL